MIKPFYIKRHDLRPYYYCQVLDADGNPVDLSGATIYCTMKASDGTLKIDRKTAGVVITNAANGEFEYRWQAGDTDTTGTYMIEFEVNPAAGGKFTVPVKEVARVIVVEDYDNN